MSEACSSRTCPVSCAKLVVAPVPLIWSFPTLKWRRSLLETERVFFEQLSLAPACWILENVQVVKIYPENECSNVL